MSGSIPRKNNNNSFYFFYVWATFCCFFTTHCINSNKPIIYTLFEYYISAQQDIQCNHVTSHKEAPNIIFVVEVSFRHACISFLSLNKMNTNTRSQQSHNCVYYPTETHCCELRIFFFLFKTALSTFSHLRNNSKLAISINPYKNVFSILFFLIKFAT